MKDEFWKIFHDQVNLRAYDKIWRDRMDAHSAAAEWPPGLSGIKFMSYIGAIKVEWR